MIDVLLAVYRPRAWELSSQRASVCGQKGVDVNLIVRADDVGAGACANFASLLEESVAPYIAFSDQDDVWLENKLSRSMAKMRELESQYGKDTPLLVFTDAKVVDSDLNILDASLFHRTKIDPRRLKPEQLILQKALCNLSEFFRARALASEVKSEGPQSKKN